MATLKSKGKAEKKEVDEELIEVNFEQEEDEVFEMLAGYKDNNGVIHKEFTLREINGKDEEAISKTDVKSNGSKVASILLSRCVTRIGSYIKSKMPSEDWMNIIRELYTGDQDYMLMKLREMSFGSEVIVSHVCPNKECRAKLTTTMDMGELSIVPFKGERILVFELPKGYRDKKGEVHKNGEMRLTTGLDREILTPLARTNLAKAETVMLTRLCKFSDGSYIDEDIMSSLVARDRNYLQKLLQENYFGINLDVEVTCDSCGETFTGSFNALNFI